MAMIERLRAAHPGSTISAFDGHYARIGDAESHILDHVEVRHGDRTTSISAHEPGRRNKPHPKAVEARLDRLIGDFEKQAA